jgi:esterase/lipase
MKKAALGVLLLAVIYLLGPTPDRPVYDSSLPETTETAFIESFVSEKESAFPVKPGNEAEIFWADSMAKQKTEVALVYIHGFTASHQEGFPIHREFAERYGCNLYLARLAGHGLATENPLIDYNPDRVWNSAKEAFAIGKKLGEKVVVMSTSTGGTLALRLAATYADMGGLINYSPNIAINDPAAFLLNDPWGLQLARLTFGGDFRSVSSDDEYRKYWYDRYRLEAIVALQELVETTCEKDLFAKVTCPVFNGVYYKDEEHQDEVVRVDAVRTMHAQLGTHEDLKVMVEFPNAETHVIANQKRSKSYDEVREATFEFAERQLGLRPVDESNHKSQQVVNLR